MKLFISYARVDKPLCKQIVHHLEDIHDIWCDKRLHAGQDWCNEIQERLEWYEGFTYLLSPESVASKYCQKEHAPIRELVQRKATRELGCSDFAEFKQDFPDYDPDDMATVCQQASSPLPAQRSGDGENKRLATRVPFIPI